MRAGAIALVAGLLTGDAAAQGVRGRVMDADTDELLSGAIVVAEGRDGRALARTLTGIAGAFALVVAGADTVRLLVERIGYDAWRSAPLAVPADRWVDVPVRVPPVRAVLGEVVTQAPRVCIQPDQAGPAAARLWAEARKALLATTLTEEQPPVGVRTTTYERLLDPERGAPMREVRRYGQSLAKRPFRALPAPALVTAGWASYADDAAAYFAPDADVLLSDAFAAAHCFGVALPADSTADEVGLTFTPRLRPRGVVTLAGTVWLAREELALRRVEFRYLGLPGLGDDRRFQGRVGFRRLADGRWLVDDWVIRMPIYGVGDPKQFTPQQIATMSLAAVGPAVFAVKEEGGALLEVLPPETVLAEGLAASTDLPTPSPVTGACPPLADTMLARLQATVVEARGGRPVAGARVQVAWQQTGRLVVGGREVFREPARYGTLMTDAEGQVRLCEVPRAARVSLSVEGEGFRRAWREVRLQGDTLTRVRVPLPR